MTYIEGQRFGAVRALVSVYANEGLAALEKAGLQTDDNKLHPRALETKEVSYRFDMTQI